MADKKIRYEITADSSGFEKGFKRAADSTGVLDKAVQNVGRSVATLGATYLGAQGIGAIIKTADTYANLDSKLKLATKSSAEFASSYDALFKMSQKTGSSFEANVTAFSGLAMAMKGTKVPTEELLKVFEDVNKSLVVAGASTVEASSFLLQFKQALGSNRLSGDEFKAMLEANSYWAGQFAKALDTDMAGLYKMKEAQQLTTEVVLDAHKRMAAGISSDFDQMEKTVARATMELSNSWKDVVGDANRAGSGTKDLAIVISGLATTITENKQTISDVFTGLIKGARVTIETIADVSRSIQGLAIVAASKDKSLTDWIMGDANTMKKWQAEFTNGTAFMKDRLVEVREKISDTADSWGKWSDKRETLARLREEEQKLMAAIEERGRATGKANTEAAASASTAAVAVSSFKDSWQIKRDLEISMWKEINDAEEKAFAESDRLAQKAAADRRKTVEEQMALQASLTNKVKEGTLSEHDYKVWALDQELVKMRETAGGKQEIIDQITEYEKIRLKEIGEVRQKSLNEDFDHWLQIQMAIDAGNKTSADTFMVLEDLKKEGFKDTLKDMEKSNRHSLTEMERDWLDFNRDVKNDFTSTLSGFLKGEFNSLGDAFDSLTDRLLDSFIDMIADMVVAWATSELFELFGFGGGSFFGYSGSIGGGSGSGGSGGYAGAVGTAVVGEGVKHYAGEYIAAPVASYINESAAAEAVYSGIAEAYYRAMGYTSASVAGASATGTGAAGTMTPGLLDAHTGYYGGTTITAESGSTIAVDGGTTIAAESGTAAATTAWASNAAADSAGTYAASATAAEFGATEAATTTGAAGATGAAGGVIGMMAAFAYMIGTAEHGPIRNSLNESRATPTRFGEVAGVEASGELTRISEEASQALTLMNHRFSEISAISIDAANGIAVLGTNMTSEDGLITGVKYSIETFDNAAGAWVRSQVDFQDLLDTMSDMGPVSDDAITTTAQYVAEMAGVPTVADELAIAFKELQTGIYGVAGAASSGAGTLANAIAMFGATGGEGYHYGEGWDQDPSIPGSYAWNDAQANGASNIDYGEPMGHAAGGIHRGGWRLVGEKGPELEYTPPSRIFNNTDTQSIIGQSDKTSQAIADLKEVVIGAIMASSEKMRRIENTVMRWEKIGLPAARA